MTGPLPPIAVYYEHPDWFRPLFAELERRGTPYVRLDASRHRYDPAEPAPPFPLLFNRMSASAYLRGHGNTTFYTRNYLAHLVFLCHTHAFTFMVVIVLTLLRMLDAALPALGGAIEVLGWVLLLLYMPAYYFLAMRRVYAQGVLLTLLKQIVLMTAYLFVITLVFSVGFIVVMLVS